MPQPDRLPIAKLNMQDQALVPASNALLLMDLAREHGLDADALLSEMGMRAAELCEHDRFLTARQCSRLMAEVRDRTGVQALGYEMGLRTPGTAHGLFSLGMLSSASPLEALELATRYFQLRNPTFGMTWAMQGPYVAVTLQDLMPNAAMRQASTEWVLLSMVRMGEALMGAKGASVRTECELTFTWDRPPYHADYAARLPICHFNAQDTSARFPAAWLMQRLAGAAPASVQLARKACERDLALRVQSASLTQRVRAVLDAKAALGTYLSRDAVAKELNMSVSTLKRQLLQEGGSYSALLDDVRLRDAQRLLTNMAATVENVAAQLGYQNTANFTRAFKQWTGMTPTQWRSAQG